MEQPQPSAESRSVPEPDTCTDRQDKANADTLSLHGECTNTTRTRQFDQQWGHQLSGPKRF